MQLALLVFLNLLNLRKNWASLSVRHLANLKYFMSILKIVKDTYYIIYFICLMKIDLTLEKQIRFLKYFWLAKVSLLMENFAS